jgi:hypothetical protein
MFQRHPTNSRWNACKILNKTKNYDGQSNCILWYVRLATESILQLIYEDRCNNPEDNNNNNSYQQWSTRYKNKHQFVLLEYFANFKGWSKNIVCSDSNSQNLQLSHEYAENGQRNILHKTIHYCTHHSSFWSLCAIVLFISTCEILTDVTTINDQPHASPTSMFKIRSAALLVNSIGVALYLQFQFVKWLLVTRSMLWFKLHPLPTSVRQGVADVLNILYICL